MDYHFPPRGVQYRKAAVALKVMDIFLDFIAPIIAELDTRWRDRVQRIARRHAECGKAIVGMQVSAGARRDINAQADALKKHLVRIRSIDGTDTPQAVGALIVAIGGLVCDAVCTAPAVTHKTSQGGSPLPEWAWLNRLMDRLADDFVELCPGCDELGTEIYMEVSR